MALDIYLNRERCVPTRSYTKTVVYKVHDVPRTSGYSPCRSMLEIMGSSISMVPHRIHDGDLIRLDVGGISFTTSEPTLKNATALHALAASTASTARRNLGLTSDIVMIDRDPKHFWRILSFLRNGFCAMPNTTAELLALRVEAEAYKVRGLLHVIDSSTSMRVHRHLTAASRESRGLLYAAADALLGYAYGRLPASKVYDGGGSERDDALSSAFRSIALDKQQAQGLEESEDPSPEELQAWAGMAADVINVDVRVAVSTTASVQGRYSCILNAAISGPAATKTLRHQYTGSGPPKSPLELDNWRTPFYDGLTSEEQAIWDEIMFMRCNSDAIARTACSGGGSCFRVTTKLQTPKAASAHGHGDSSSNASEKRQEWEVAFDSTLIFGISLM